MNGKLFSAYSVDVRLSRRAFIVFKVHRRGCRNSTIRRKVHMHEEAYPMSYLLVAVIILALSLSE